MRSLMISNIIILSHNIYPKIKITDSLMKVALLMKKMETRLKISKQRRRQEFTQGMWVRWRITPLKHVQLNQITSQAATTAEAHLHLLPTIWKKINLVKKNNLIWIFHVKAMQKSMKLHNLVKKMLNRMWNKRGKRMEP